MWGCIVRYVKASKANGIELPAAHGWLNGYLAMARVPIGRYVSLRRPVLIKNMMSEGRMPGFLAEWTKASLKDNQGDVVINTTMIPYGTQRGCQLLHPAAAYYPCPQRKYPY